MRRIGLTAVLLLCACQPQARRLLVLDLALSEPALLNGTVQPWRDEGYNIEYRRFYPHLARADLDRYRVLLFLLGREPEAPSDALTVGALGPQFRPTTAPLQQPDALERTRGFLTALARWTRRPAEWAHVPPAARGVPVALQQAPAPVELVPPPLAPPAGVDTIGLPLVP